MTDTPEGKAYVHGTCPHCQAPWRAAASVVGRQARCPQCGEVFPVEAATPDKNAPSVPESATAQPERIPGYEIECELGHGGMGMVYRARDLSTKRTVALKVMLAGQHATDHQRRRFEREVEIAASLEHANIARLYASGLHERHYWFAMQYVEGECLDRFVAREKLGVRTLLGLFVPICEAVNHAHQRGIMHRDLKPGNILVDGQARPHVLDFGLAKPTDAGIGDDVSIEGQIAGTPAYMSPEQTTGDPSAVDVRTDVYSLGVILYRLLTGHSPYGDGEASLAKLFRAINESDPMPPHRLRKEIPDEVSAIVLKALEKAPARRYQSAGEMGRDLRAYLSGEPVTAKQGSGLYMLRKLAVRHRGLAGAVAAVVVLSLGLGTVMSVLFATTRIEVREVIRTVEVYRREIVRMGGDPNKALAEAGLGPIGASPPPVRLAEAMTKPAVDPNQGLAKAPAGPIPARVRFVRALAKPGGDGRSWANAYADLQDALAVSGPGQEIWASAGRYRPDKGTGDRSATFRIKSGVSIYGGFAGNETGRNQRDPRKNQTILSGDLKGDDGPDFANNADNSLHVVTGNGADATAVLDGFTVTGGNAGAGNERGDRPDLGGGGMLNDAGGPTVVNCTFRGNSANNDGGAMCCTNGSSPRIVRCTFERNRASNDGGAIRNAGSNPTLVNCIFRGNSAGLGGAVSNMMNANPVLANCVFVGNSAGNHGGAVSSMGSCSPALVGCTFRANSAKAFGAAIASVADSHPKLTNCILWGNTLGGRTDESAQIQGVQNGEPVINHCCIQGWSGQLGGKGNIAADPQFVDPDGPDKIAGTADDDLRLRPGSPCIDAGDTAELPMDSKGLDGDGDRTEPIPRDLAGLPRVVGGKVDIGAFGYQRPTPARPARAAVTRPGI